MATIVEKNIKLGHLLEKKKKLDQRIDVVCRTSVYKLDCRPYKGRLVELLLESDENPYRSEFGVNSKEDQLKLLAYMQEQDYDFSKRLLGAMFTHADNVRYACAEQDIELPQWFAEKYAELLAQ